MERNEEGDGLPCCRCRDGVEADGHAVVTADTADRLRVGSSLGLHDGSERGRLTRSLSAVRLVYAALLQSDERRC